MIPVLILLMWASTGVIASATLRDGEPHPWAWAPIAAILGPLWIAVALDQRGARQLEAATIPVRDPHLDERAGNYS